MSPYARIQILADSAKVRFEGIKSRVRFDAIRDRFYKNIPTAKWDQQVRWMNVSGSDLTKLLDFAYQEFGVGNVKVDHKMTKSWPRQLRLDI